MGDDIRESLGTYVRWADGFSPESLERSLEDLATVRRGQLNASDDYYRPTPAGLSPSHYAKLSADRDDLDSRNWNSDAGFFGLQRGPVGPGVLSDNQRRRQQRREELDDGF